jgi:hypothetical protein
VLELVSWTGYVQWLVHDEGWTVFGPGVALALLLDVHPLVMAAATC